MLIGESPAFREVVRLVDRMSACEAPVLIEGETGTGKELVARAIHYQSPRKDRPFIPVNCGALPDSLVESELFGYRKGAFTDAKNHQPGLVTLAEGGSLFFDEVDSLSPKGQVTLLRFLQDQEFRPLGACQVQHADVRVLAASNANLSRLAEQGAFRMDLLYRLRILYLELPPLRKRGGDVARLSASFLEACDKRFGLGRKRLHPDTLAWMDAHAWPGNVRELENLLYREYLLSDGPEISILAPQAAQGWPPAAAAPARMPEGELVFQSAKARAIEAFERAYLVTLMDKAEGNVSLAARLAGKERRSLGKLLKKHGLGAGGTPRAARQVEAPRE